MRSKKSCYRYKNDNSFLPCTFLFIYLSSLNFFYVSISFYLFLSHRVNRKLITLITMYVLPWRPYAASLSSATQKILEDYYSSHNIRLKKLLEENNNNLDKNMRNWYWVSNTRMVHCRFILYFNIYFFLFSIYRSAIFCNKSAIFSNILPPAKIIAVFDVFFLYTIKIQNFRQFFQFCRGQSQNHQVS